jgi:phosphatidylinositol glycan class B
LAGVGIDYIGYGSVEFTLWNFYVENIVNGAAASFGTSPWWRYFYEVQKEFHPVIGVPVVLSFLYFWIKNWKSPITWMSLSFFVFHSLIAHKEIRFIFPLVVFVPYVLCWSMQEVWTHRKSLKVYFGLFFLVNSLYLFAVAFRPAYHGIDFYRYLYKNNHIKVLHYVGKTKPLNIVNFDMKFYQIFGKNYHEVASLDEALLTAKYVYFHGRSGRDYLKLKKDSRCKELYPKISSFEKYIYYKNKIERNDVYYVFECDS